MPSHARNGASGVCGGGGGRRYAPNPLLALDLFKALPSLSWVPLTPTHGISISRFTHLHFALITITMISSTRHCCPPSESSVGGGAQPTAGWVVILTPQSFPRQPAASMFFGLHTRERLIFARARGNPQGPPDITPSSHLFTRCRPNAQHWA